MSVKPTDWLNALKELRKERLQDIEKLEGLLNDAIVGIKDVNLLNTVAGLFTNMKTTSHDHVRRLGEILDSQRLSKAIKKLQSK